MDRISGKPLYLNRGLSDAKLSIKQKPGSTIAGRRVNQCKDPEARISLDYLKKRETIVVGINVRELARSGEKWDNAEF